VAADAHRLAAELEIEAERYKAARRHLRAAASLDPTNARTYYLTGRAFEADPQGDDRRAAVWFRKASRQEPANPLYRAALGRAAVRCDRVKLGVRELTTAAEATVDNIPVLRIAVDGLLEAGKVRTARRVLTKARFLCPGSRDVRMMWERTRFEFARVGQNQLRGTQDATFATEGATFLLPFVRVVRPEASGEGSVGQVRRDVVSFPRPHVGRLPFQKADR
jgi:predicted Zn-dependent protease